MKYINKLWESNVIVNVKEYKDGNEIMIEVRLCEEYQLKPLKIYNYSLFK